MIPLIETINPSARESIIRTAEHLSQVENIYRAYIDQVKLNLFKDNKINISLLVQYIEPEAILFEILSPYGFNSATVRQIFESIIGQSGKIFYSETHELLKDRGSLILKKKATLFLERFSIREEDKLLLHPLHLEFKKEAVSDNFSFEKRSNIIYLDTNKITYPLTLRKWQQGDWFIPFGMKGKKKVSDFFTDKKFTLFEKEDTWLLCSGEDIIWIVGHRADDRFKITDQTTDVLKITLNE